MNIGIPRALIVSMAAIFSAYHIVLALYSLGTARDAGPVVLAMVLYAIASTVSLLPWGPVRMPVWMAAFNVAMSVAIIVLVSHELDPGRPGGNGYATWYVAAIGTLMTITSSRRRHAFAWAGIVFLVVQTIVWAGPGALGGLGVVGSASWVAISHILSSAMAKATRDAQRFAIAEREAAEWQAAQEAHLYERRFRLAQTSTMAIPMLRQIQASGGDLTDEQRRECLYLEGAIRDEIRGRRLLNDAVREQVMLARRRGVHVTLHDDGGLDELPDEELARVQDELARAIAGSRADRMIVRTAPEGSDDAVTVVGLRSSGDGTASALGDGSDGDDEVELWLTIPRVRDSGRPAHGATSAR